MLDRSRHRHRLERLAPLAAGLGFTPHTALVHADAQTPDVAELIAEMAERTRTGYLFGDYDAGAMLSVIGQATGLYRGDRTGFDTVRYRGMTADFSWGRSAAAYRHIYVNL